jgi:3alpha(or 20beta)-hydroxysteroid dehydrogenase
MSERLVGKTAIITGAANGQGAAEAELFTSEGAKVVIADIAAAEGRALAECLGASAIFCELDVTDPTAWANVVEQAVAQFGGLHVLVNNAGGTLGRSGPLADMSIEDYDVTIALNLTGPWLGTRAAVPAMRKSGSGSIINVSSIGGFVGLPGIGAYGMAKWGLRGLSRTTAIELSPDNIRVNSVHPGFIDTPGSSGTDLPRIINETKHYRGMSVPSGRAGVPLDIANMVLFLASDESSYCTGAEFVVDGGALAGAIVT